MKTLTLSQPYATLVAIGVKRIETRSWRTDYRGPLLIHAAKGLGPVGGVAGLRNLVQSEPFRSVFVARDAYMGTRIVDDPSYYLPRGAIIAMCTLLGCRTIGGYYNSPAYIMPASPPVLIGVPERLFGDYTEGRYAWLLSNIRVLPEPIPCKSAMGLWEYTGALPS